jgi:arginyl-tRNA synthetase
LVTKFIIKGEIIQKINSNELNKEIKEKKEKIMIEYSQPNTHKAFHVGHFRNVSLGNSLIRLHEFQKYKIISTNYIGDEGVFTSFNLDAHCKMSLVFFKQKWIL